MNKKIKYINSLVESYINYENEESEESSDVNAFKKAIEEDSKEQLEGFINSDINFIFGLIK